MREFYQILSQLLDAGDSVLMATILSGSDAGRDLTAQKALFQENRLVVQEESLRGLWETLGADLSAGGYPCIHEVQGCKLLVEQLCAREQLILCGGGHIALSLAALGAMLDFDVIVMDDRPEFANAERFPMAKQVICAPFSEGFAQIEDRSSNYYVIITRGHKDDRTCLEQILHRRFAYVGMIGSRRKVGVVMEQMETDGYDSERLKQVHAPIGLRIGAQTPAEIGVCIAAELIQTRSGSTNSGFDRQALAKLSAGEPMMLASIIEKKGSAPRGLGAKMLVDAAGNLYGTVGGGAAEGEVVAMAPQVMAEGTPRMVTCNMTNADAQQAGMVCGGVVTMLLEPIV